MNSICLYACVLIYLKYLGVEWLDLMVNVYLTL